MVLSIKTAACASYYWQGWGPAEKPATAEGVWLRAPKGLGVAKGGSVQKNWIGFCAARRRRRAKRQRLASKTGSAATILCSARQSRCRCYGRSHHPGGRSSKQRTNMPLGGLAALLADRAICERVGKGGKRLENADGALAAFFHFRCRPAQHAAFGEVADRATVFPDPNLHTHLVAPDIVLSRGAPEQQRLKIAYTALYKRWSMALGACTTRRSPISCGSRVEIEPAGGNGLFQLKLFRREDPRRLQRPDCRGAGLGSQRRVRRRAGENAPRAVIDWLGRA